MGNNAAYTIFEQIVINIYDQGVLNLALLDRIGKEYEGMDVDSGGSRDLETEDGKSLKEVCIELVDPEWKPEEVEDEEDENNQKYYKWMEIRNERWGWT